MKKTIILALLTLSTNLNSLHANKLHDAVQAGDVADVLTYLRWGINSYNQNKHTPLHLAAWHGHKEIVAELIKRNALLNPLDSYGNTPLRYAARNDHHEIVTLLINALIKKNLSQTISDKQKNSPIHAAASNNACKSAQIILASLDKELAHKYVNAPNKQCISPLHLAAQKSHFDMVDFLIRQWGAKVDVCDIWGYTPLRYAVRKNHWHMVSHLIDRHKADIHALDDCGNTHLHAAAKYGAYDAAYILMRHGINLWAKNCFGESALDLAIDFNHDDLRKLIEYHQHVTCLHMVALLLGQEGDDTEEEEKKEKEVEHKEQPKAEVGKKEPETKETTADPSDIATTLARLTIGPSKDTL